MELMTMLIFVLLAFYLGWTVGKALEKKKADGFLMELRKEVAR